MAVRKPRGFCYDKDQHSKSCLIEFIEGRKKTMKKTNTMLGELLGITGQGFGYQINPEKGNGGFSYIQLVKLFKELNASDEEILRLMKQG